MIHCALVGSRHEPHYCNCFREKDENREMEENFLQDSQTHAALSHPILVFTLSETQPPDVGRY